jgi:hypothetical protein
MDEGSHPFVHFSPSTPSKARPKRSSGEEATERGGWASTRATALCLDARTNRVGADPERLQSSTASASRISVTPRRR